MCCYVLLGVVLLDCLFVLVFVCLLFGEYAFARSCPLLLVLDMVCAFRCCFVCVVMFDVVTVMLLLFVFLLICLLLFIIVRVQLFVSV